MGGIGTNTATLAPALARRGHVVSVVTPGEGSVREEDDVTVARLDHRWLPTRPARTLAARVAIERAVRRFKPDVVQAAEWSAEAWWLTRRDSRPVVTRLATPSYVLGQLNRLPIDRHEQLVRWLERDQTQRSAAIYAPTRAIAERVAKDWDLDRERIALIPNPIDVQEVLEAGAMTPPLSLPARYVVFNGRLERRKGVEVLAQALRRVLGEDLGLEAVLIGRDPGDENGLLTRRVLAHLEPVRDRVHLLGELPRADALAVVARSEVAVVPSLWESFGYVAVEAMALGRPLIAARAGGLTEIVEHGRTGWLVPPGDADALAACLLERLADSEGSARAGLAAVEAARRYDVNTVVDTLVELFERTRQRTTEEFDRSLYRRGYRQFFRADDRRDPFHALYEAKRDAVLSGFDVKRKLKLLDAGGGYGRIAGPLARNHDVTLCDISPEMLEEAQKRWPSLHLVEADARSLPFGDRAFDAVLAIDLLPHFPDLEAGVRELARVVRPGGRVVFDTSNASPWWVLAFPSYVNWRPRRLLRTLRGGGVLPEWQRLVSHHRAAEVRLAIAASGLRLERVETFGPSWTPKWHLWWTTAAPDE